MSSAPTVPPSSPSPPSVPGEPTVNALGVITWQGRQWRLLSEGQTILDPELVSHAIKQLMAREVATKLADRIKPPTPGSPAEPAFSVHFKPDGTVSVIGPSVTAPPVSSGPLPPAPLPPSPDIQLDPSVAEALHGAVQDLTAATKGPIARAKEAARTLYNELSKAGHGPKSVQDAIDHILSEGALFVSEEAGHEDEACYERTLRQCLLERENRFLLEALHEVRSMAHDAISKADQSHWFDRLRGVPSKQVVGAEQAVRHFLLPRLFRAPKAIGTTGEGQFVQHFASPKPKRDGRYPFEPGHAQPCLDPDNEPGISNLGVVLREGGGVATIRSGPATSDEKVVQLVQFALEREAEQPAKLRRIRDVGGTLHFQHHITSLFDPSQTGKAVKRTEKDEEAYLRSLLHGCDALRTTPQTVTMSIDGRDQQVVIDPPIVSQELFSSTPAGEAIKKRMNQLATLRMLGQAEHSLSASVNAKIAQAFSTFRVALQADATLSSTDPTGTSWSLEHWALGEGDEKSIQESSAFKNYMHALENILRDEVHAVAEGDGKLVAKAFLVQLTGRDEDQKPLDAMDQEIYRNLLTERLGLSSSKQDRDGLEKTGVAVALQEAQARFRARSAGFAPSGGVVLAPTGGLPLPAPDRGDFRPDMGDAGRKEFKQFFREALLRHGVDVFAEATGYSGARLFSSAERFGATKLKAVQRYLGDEELASRLTQREGAARRVRSMSLWKEKMSEDDRKKVVQDTEQALRQCFTPPLAAATPPAPLPFVFSHENLTIAQVSDSGTLDPAKIRAKITALKQEITQAYEQAGLKGYTPFSRMGFFKRLFKTDPMTQPEVQQKYFQAVLLEQVLHAQERSIAEIRLRPAPTVPPPLSPPPLPASPSTSPSPPPHSSPPPPPPPHHPLSSPVK